MCTSTNFEKKKEKQEILRTIYRNFSLGIFSIAITAHGEKEWATLITP
jgi:hypothetical protein